MADSPVQVNVREGEAHGQAQARSNEPFNGTHKVYEAVAVTDHVILDANSPDAVQIPEGVGASTAGHRSPLGEALSRGTVEERFNPKDESEAPAEEPADA